MKYCLIDISIIMKIMVTCVCIEIVLQPRFN